MSLDCRVHTPISSPGVRRKPRSLGVAGDCQQVILQPRRIVALDTEGFSKYPRVVPASWMQWTETIVLKFPDIEDSVISVRQK